MKPSLWDEKWRRFILAKEENSELASRDWRRYQAGIRRLDAMYRATVPQEPMRLALAEDVFFCAAHWKQSPRVVRAALLKLLALSPDAELFAFAAAEYWQWATAKCPADIGEADTIVKRARARLHELGPLERENVQRLYARVIGSKVGDK